MALDGPIILCGLDLTPQDRGDCPDPLHDWPLPAGYGAAHDTAHRRLNRGWRQRRCPSCRLYGWVPGRRLDDGTDVHVPHTTTEEPA